LKHVCIDKVIIGKEPSKYLSTAEDTATRNLDAPVRLAVVRDKLWDVGATVRVKFLEGDAVVQSKVRSFATQWMKYANIKIEFVEDGNAEVRIAFDENDGSWSFIGRDALDIPQDESSMNYGWLTPETEDTEYSRVVLHEFGHSLGAIHEHQNPAAGIPWNKEAVYEYYMGPPNNWTKDDVDNNLFRRYSKTITNFTNFDDGSIMLYPIPAEFTTTGIAIGGNNSILSDLDKNFMQQQYPYPTVRIHSKGPAVASLQQCLVKLGYNLGSASVDGDFGPLTDAAVKKFQKDRGLVVDGIVGKNTWREILSSCPPI
jgi:serralysin